MSHVKFVVQTLPRCGAGVVMSALQQHPQCEVHGCVFAGDSQEAADLLRGAANWRDVFNRHTEPPAAAGTTASGFIAYCVPQSLQMGLGVRWEWSTTLWQYLGDKGRDEAKIVRIWREDPIARAISVMFTIHTGTRSVRDMTSAARMYVANHPVISINAAVFRQLLDEWEQSAAMPQLPGERLQINYEMLLINWPAELSKLQQFLGLGVQQLSPQLAKMGKLPPHTFVENWDILVESFRNTRYEGHFDKYLDYFAPQYVRVAKLREAAVRRS